MTKNKAFGSIIIDFAVAFSIGFFGSKFLTPSVSETEKMLEVVKPDFKIPETPISLQSCCSVWHCLTFWDKELKYYTIRFIYAPIKKTNSRNFVFIKIGEFNFKNMDR